jgi:hypothetical protein
MRKFSNCLLKTIRKFLIILSLDSFVKPGGQLVRVPASSHVLLVESIRRSNFIKFDLIIPR